ncbi:centrosomal protein of 290 kDa [Orussus abietinus]|uniref:centrosomal protein of 290 kDa n=1 Tax=Orussus abietinus TaxID=222816 RepID=UPI0006268BAB|nr:centrosomal protein of 290 kDa [Orussus abietinus]
MVQINWERILAIRPAQLSDEEIEDLFPMVVRCNVDDVDDAYNLKVLMKLSQEMLQHKDNQVESLLLECDELKEKLSSVSPQLPKNSMKEQLASDFVNEDSMYNERVPQPVNPNYEDLLLERNDKIKTLISELEELEDENVALKEKLRVFKNEMEDATKNMNEVAEKLSTLQNENVEYKENITHLERQNAALVSQVEDLANQQSYRDKVIDDFGTAIDARIAEWKSLLDEKDAEISRLKEDLAQSSVHSHTFINEQNSSEIVQLNEEIQLKDATIEELRGKLSEAVDELNESAAVIEKFKTSAKNGKQKEHRELLKKLQDAYEEISNLKQLWKHADDDAKLKSKELCESLAILKKYENKHHSLKEAMDEVKDLREELDRKRNHIEDLVQVINKLEALNSYQETEITALREKLGISENEEISTDVVLAKRKEQARETEELKRLNRLLMKENLETKAELRTVRFKFNKLTEKSKEPAEGMINDKSQSRMTKMSEMSESDYSWVAEQDKMSLRHMSEIDEIKGNVRIVIEENEALRRGMQEILDSIHDQDGKGTVEIQSDTLERLLEALDVRHVAGWYHPAMRLQSRLNVIQGSNAELRVQLKQIRKELKRKDDTLRRLVVDNVDKEKSDSEKSEIEDTSIFISELRKSEETRRQETEEFQKEKSTLLQERTQLEDRIAQLSARLEEYDKSWQLFELSEDGGKKAFVESSKALAEAVAEKVAVTRKHKMLEELLGKESVKLYRVQKEAVARESNLRKILADTNKRGKILETEIATLRSNLNNSVSTLQYNELKEKYEETSLRLRMNIENQLAIKDSEEVRFLRTELELVKGENEQLVESLQKRISESDEDDPKQKLNQLKSKELIERQRANHMTKLHEISQSQLAKCEANLEETARINSELREQLIQLHNKLSKYVNTSRQSPPPDDRFLELEERVNVLQTENEHLQKTVDISRDEAQMHYTLNSLKTLEVDNLRHQILDLQAISEDKETIAKLGFELTNCKASEIELNKRKAQLENETIQQQEELHVLKKDLDELRNRVIECKKQCDIRCRTYLDVIDFLQRQYAGSTSTSALERFDSAQKQLARNRMELEEQLKKAKETSDRAKLQQDELTNRLQIVEQLKAILEEQIGGSNVQDILNRFSENSQQTISDFRYKRRIAQLEYELEINNGKLEACESTISIMELEMMEMQKIWGRKSEPSSERIISQESKEVQSQDAATAEQKTVSTQIEIKNFSIAVQTETLSLSTEVKDAAIKKSDACLPNESKIIDDRKEEKALREGPQDVTISTRSKKANVILNADNEVNLNEAPLSNLHEQFRQALNLASERSATIIKYESQIVEYQARISVLNKTIEEKDLQVAQRDKIIERVNRDSSNIPMDSTDKIALKSTVNSLQQILTQKEETITRYQNLLKEDRDEHSKAAARFQEEIKSLHERILRMENDAEVKSKNERDRTESVDEERKFEMSRRDLNRHLDLEEEAAKLREKVLTLEADLNITEELSERWHRLAEERLKHMDHMRDRLEEYHKKEIESYRAELDKWQAEADSLRQQLSENRMQLTKGNISLAKELQERDNKIHELSMTHQQLQNELKITKEISLSQKADAHESREYRVQEMAHNISRDQTNHMQSQLDILRRQLQAMMEKEKIYKSQIVDMKQQLSRRYMAVKTQEKKASQRETQLDRKVKTLEEELHKARAQLEREYHVHEAKKAKTAEELALWDKQKKWQQTAEKLKEKLKEKTEEGKRLQTTCDKLRSVISCMDREKWYLKSKLRVENGTVSGGLSSRPVSDFQFNVIENLQVECETLRERVKQLTDRLENEENSQLIRKIEEQRRRIAALETLVEGNSYVVDRLEKLEAAKEHLQRTNIKLESENFELKLEIEKLNLDTPRLREKIEHLEKYVELLKVEKSSDSSPRSLDRESHEQGSKKSLLELEKTVFILKRVVERLQAENKRLRVNSKHCHCSATSARPRSDGLEVSQELYKKAKQRVVALETDLQLAEQRIAMLENARKEDDSTGEVNLLKQQLAHKSELLDKVKQLLTRAAVNEKALRQKVQQLEMKQTLNTIPECFVTPPPLESDTL